MLIKVSPQALLWAWGRIMRGDYVVVPPNSARVEVCVPEVLGSAPAPGPDSRTPIINLIIKIILK